MALPSPLLPGVYAWCPTWNYVPYLALVPWVRLYADDRDPPASAGLVLLQGPPPCSRRGAGEIQR